MAGTATSIGGLGLLYAGLGWVDALREAMRMLWHQSPDAGNIVVKKAKDVVVLLGLGLTLVASVVVSGVTTTGTRFVLAFVNLQDHVIANVALWLLGHLLSLGVTVLIFLYLFTRMSRISGTWREVWKGAVLGAVLFELLKIVGSVYISRTTSNPIYGTFAVAIGLLVWINLVSRVSLLVAAWTVTAPYDDDVAPSGTASLHLATEAGIPLEEADPEAGPRGRHRAPGASVAGRVSASGRGGASAAGAAVAAHAERREADRRAAGRPAGAPSGAPAAAATRDDRSDAVLPGEAATRRAAQVGAGLLVASAAGIAVYGARTWRER